VRFEQRLPERSLKTITAQGKSITIPSQWERVACLLSQSDHEEQKSTPYTHKGGTSSLVMQVNNWLNNERKGGT